MPYFDPAISYIQRQEISRITYGFECTCTYCRWTESLGVIAEPANFDGTVEELKKVVNIHNGSPISVELPKTLHCVFHESFLPRLSSKFSDLSHDGPFLEALGVGKALATLYLFIYPPGYPMIGIHIYICSALLLADEYTTSRSGLHYLEMAKTAWNYLMQNDPDAAILQECRKYCMLAKEILQILKAGDREGSVSKDISMMESLLMNECMSIFKRDW